MASSLFNAGQAFRQAVLTRNVTPYQYGALLQDICSDHRDLKPALIDLSARQLFRELPFRGTQAQKMLSKDRLLAELGPLYRDEVLAQLLVFIDGALDLAVIHQTDDSPQTMGMQSAYGLHQNEDDIQNLGSFYADNPSRLLLLSVISFGLYTCLWSYRHWRHYKRIAMISQPKLLSRKKDGRINPFWCAVFVGFYIVGVARRIKLRLADLNTQHNPIRPWLIFALFSLLPWVPNLYQSTESVPINAVLLIITFSTLFISCLQLYLLQKLANRVLMQENNQVIHYRSLNMWDWLFVVSGSVILLLAIIGTLVPPSWLGA